MAQLIPLNCLILNWKHVYCSGETINRATSKRTIGQKPAMTHCKLLKQSPPAAGLTPWQDVEGEPWRGRCRPVKAFEGRSTRPSQRRGRCPEKYFVDLITITPYDQDLIDSEVTLRELHLQHAVDCLCQHIC